MLPEGWKSQKVEELGEVQAGRQRSPHFKDGNLTPYLRVANVFDGRIDTSDVNSMYFTEKEFARFELRPGDILLNEGQSAELVGRPAMYMGIPPRCCFQNTLIRFRPSAQIDPHYALKRFQLCLYDGTFTAIAKKTTSIAHLGVSRFAGLQLDWPTLPEQHYIGQILSTWDQAVVVLEKLKNNSRIQWHALLSELLHLPAPSPSTEADSGSFPASVQPGIPSLPSVPSDWRRVHLREHLKEVRRPVALKDDESYTLVTVKRSRGGVVRREILRGSEVKTPTQFYIHTGDFLISKRQIVHGACGIVPSELDGAVVSNEYAVISSDGEIDLRFLRYLSESRYFQQTCFHSSIGVHVEKMIFKTDQWLNWPFNIPPLAQQKRIVEILDAAGRESVAISKQVEALKRERLALMSQLLTGKRRVKLTEEDNPAQT